MLQITLTRLFYNITKLGHADISFLLLCTFSTTVSSLTQSLREINIIMMIMARSLKIDVKKRDV